MSKISLNEFGNKANSTLDHLMDELKKVRSGRANPALVEDVQVEAYGSVQPLKNLANINVQDAQMLTIQPWDKSVLNDIVKAINESNIGINPVNAGDLIRLPMPPLTEERRKEYVKIVKDLVEQTRITVRNLRKDAISFYKSEKEEGNISEDEQKGMEKKIQSKVDEVNKKIEEIGEKKETELMSL